MLTAQIEDRTQETHHVADRQTVSGDAPLFPIVALEQQVTESLTGWIEQQDHHDVAETFRQIGQIGFRRGVQLHDLLQAIHRWTKQAIVTRIQESTDSKSTTMYQKHQNLQHAALEFGAFVRHYVIRGYQDAVR